MSEFQRHPSEVGALWLRVSEKGNKFMSGTIQGIGAVVVFKNKQAGGKRPDYRVFKSQPKPQTAPDIPPVDEDDIGF